MRPKPNKLYYLATPYSCTPDDITIKTARFKTISKLAGTLLRNGFNIYSPISHSHPITLNAGLQGDWQTWQQLNSHMMLLSDVLLIANVDGWQSSVGVRKEIDFFLGMDRPIYLLSNNAHGESSIPFYYSDSFTFWNGKQLSRTDIDELLTN